MPNDKSVEQILNRKWYIQGFSAVPLFLNPCARSGFNKKEMGFEYENFFLKYKDGYCEMGYLHDDFDRLWKIISTNMSKDPEYLLRHKKSYQKNFSKFEKELIKITPEKLSTLSDKDLLETFQFVVRTLTASVGGGHMIEPIGIHLEKDFREILSNELHNKATLNEYYPILSSPTQASFLAEEEMDLLKIKQLPSQKRRSKLINHLNKYFWLKANYTGSPDITVKELGSRLKEIKAGGKDWKLIKKEKMDLMKKLHLSPELRNIIETIDFVTLWQDERKKNVLKVIGYTERVVSEISQRIKVDKSAIYYLGTFEALELKSLEEISYRQEELKKRKDGVLFILLPNEDFIAIDEKYKIFNSLIDKNLHAKDEDPRSDIHGSIANRGTATGKVVICKDVSMLDKVKFGDVLVTSMTRPEFMPALRKAVAIVTDEGGITSHAAIVARELNIPAIIGTRVATKQLRDGMTVEVRANHGFVRIIS